MHSSIKGTSMAEECSRIFIVHFSSLLVSLIHTLLAGIDNFDNSLVL